MTWFAVHLEDDPARADVRETYLQAHLDYLDRRGESVHVAGMLRPAGGDVAVGGLWLVRAASELEVRQIVEEDPFFVHRLRRSVRIWRWSPAFPGRRVSL